MLMKRLIRLLLCGSAMMSACGCSESQDILDDSQSQLCSIAIAVDGNSLVTSRTAIVDPDDNLRGKQHVTRVQLYIYKHDGDDYICVASEDVKWNHLSGAEDGLATRQKRYTTDYQGYVDDTDYLFLAVGFDDTFEGGTDNPKFNNKNSIAAFGEPESIAPVGSKLSERHFSLCEGTDVGIISQSELFAGSRTFTKAQLKGGTAVKQPIELYRRVAGIVGYFKNMPDVIEGSKVDKVVLRLYQSQNTKTFFLPEIPAQYQTPEDVPDDEYKDYITSPYSESPYFGTSGDIISSYKKTATDGGEFQLSAYMLPCAASKVKGQSTLELVFISETGDELARRRILYSPDRKPDSRSGTGIIDPSYEGDNNNALYYPIRANNFYRMGEQKKPIDLSGQTSYIYIEIDPVWDEYYGGAMDNEIIPPGLGIDKDWGEHDGGKLDSSD